MKQASSEAHGQALSALQVGEIELVHGATVGKWEDDDARGVFPGETQQSSQNHPSPQSP